MRGFSSSMAVASSVLPTSSALHDIIRDSPQSFDACAELGCSNAGSIGNDCFDVVGDINSNPDNWDDSPQNAKEVRDCICASEYWSLLTQCRACLVSKTFLPSNVPSELVQPIPTISSSFCSPPEGRTNTRTIDGWMDQATQGADVRLVPNTVIATISSLPPELQPHAITGPNGAVQTDIDESVFESLISAASLETGSVSAIAQDSSASTNAQVSSTATQSSTSPASTTNVVSSAAASGMTSGAGTPASAADSAAAGSATPMPGLGSQISTSASSLLLPIFVVFHLACF